MSQPISSARVSPGHSVRVRTPREHNARMGKAKKTKGTLTLYGYNRPPYPGMIDGPQAQGTRAACAAQGPIIPGAWIRVRLAWQVPRPIDDNLGGRPPGLIAVVMRAPAATSCILLLVEPGRTHSKAPSRQRGRTPDELVLSPRCADRLMEASFCCAEVT
ncbi:hypothetical protein LA080_003592 [Diaporthe eres]|nr:hypothetical protein LA080_003592 [Diaporthe eres]